MPYGLTIGTDRAASLQKAIEDELVVRGYSAEPDSVMAEYITIMIINNKNEDEITGELLDLIGSEYDKSFTSWLFQAAAQGASGAEAVSSGPEAAPVPTPGPSSQPATSSPRLSGGATMFQGAVVQAANASGHKRLASARSPSPTGQPHTKTRRTDVPSAPRAMGNGPPSGPRSLIDRMGAPPRQNRNPNAFANDDIQARINNITHANMGPMGPMGPMGGPMGSPMGPMGMNPQMMGGMEGNPAMLQEMMMNQMALMAQMASSMGIINPAAMGPGQFGPGGFPPQGNFNNNSNNNNNMRGGGPMRGRGRGRGGHAGSPHSPRGGGELNPAAPAFTPGEAPSGAPTPIVAPVPTSAARPVAVLPPGVAPPTRPQSPTLCKFGVKCTNATCRYSHPSPVATTESGVVLSSEACDKGPGCDDPDCVKGHVSPAAKGAVASESTKAAPPAANAVPCRFGAACARQGSGCPYQHPSSAPCRFGTACTKASCTFQHPAGRVLPNTFIRGVDGSKAVTITQPQTGSIGSQGMNKSLKFNDADKAASAAAAARADLEKKMREMEERKKAKGTVAPAVA